MKKDFMEFLKKSTTAFQAVFEMAQRLEEAGFERIREEDAWNIAGGDKKYVVRNDSSLISFSVKPLDDLRFLSACIKVMPSS